MPVHSAFCIRFWASPSRIRCRGTEGIRSEFCSLESSEWLRRLDWLFISFLIISITSWLDSLGFVPWVAGWSCLLLAPLVLLTRPSSCLKTFSSRMWPLMPPSSRPDTAAPYPLPSIWSSSASQRSSLASLLCWVLLDWLLERCESPLSDSRCLLWAPKKSESAPPWASNGYAG